MAEVNWTNQALSDIDSIAAYIAEDSLRFAKIQVERFFQKARILGTHPLSGRIVPEVNDEFIRELILGNYRIIYRICSPDLVDIIAVHHSMRILDPDTHL